MNGYHSRTSPSANSDGFGGFTSNQQPTSNSKGKQRDDGNYNSNSNYNYNLQSQQNDNYDSNNHYPQQSYSNSSQDINHQSQPRQQAFENGAPPHSQSVSPLDTLKQRSKQVTASSASPSSSNSNTNYQAAFALSRRTSLRSRTTGPGASSRRRGIGEQSLEEEEDLRHALDDGDDVRSLRSINLLAQDEDSVTPSRRNGEGYSNGNNSNGRSPRTGYEEDDTIGPQRFQDSNSPNLNNSNYRNNRESSNLLGGAFRDSIASDISFNSITGNSERNSMAPNHLLSNSSSSNQSNLYDSSTSLQRRESIDTVRSSEFGENGRWGKAWASNSDDEDSLWDGGSQMDASEWDNGSNADRRSLMERDLDLEGDEVNGLTNSMKRNTITSNPTPASLYKNEMRQQNQQRELQQQSNRHQVQVTSSNNNSPQLHPGLSRQHVVSLTPSIGNSSNARWSSSSQMDSSSPIAYPSSPNPRPKDRDSVSTIRGMSASSRDSVSTLRSGENGLDSNSNDPARVYVWPPSPAGSTASSIRSRNGDRLGSGLNPGYAPSSSSSSAGGAYSGMRIVEPQRAEIETASLYGSEASWDSQAEDQGGDYDLNSTAHSDFTEESSGSSSSGEFYDASEHRSRPTGPVGPSTILAQPLNTPLVGPGARRGNFSDGRRDSSGSTRSGHPTGRAPPPAPGGYSDPNQVMGMNPIGKTRAKAIADADGRESMISDLDVETLRLEMSSRRDSTSTVGSRMSVGTVKWGEEEQEDQLRELNSDFNGRSSLESRYGNNQNGEVEGTPKVGSISNRGLQQPAQFSGINSANTYGNNQPSNPHPFPATQRKTSLDTNTSSASSIMTSNSSSFLTSSAALSIPTNKPTPTPQPTDTRTGPTQAEELLSQGIAYHEQGDLSRSAYYLERSARTQGGCVVGMCMWGMALREGWGVRKDPKRGAEWIQRAARKAGEMMGNESNTPKSEQELKAIRSELKLSVYELGKCYCYGWGVKMDKKMSLEYFELAGKLGDPDAAAEAGALWAAGKGCKKDLKKAAAFYRMAIEAGYDGVGLSWVYKPKWL